ncbi:unnamed protein product [Amoebophrya sp. A25]|nr:unnamed protein product [Amoebophrya sp. A25]|eukprot:GSA25T00004399001.1
MFSSYDLRVANTSAQCLPEVLPWRTCQGRVCWSDIAFCPLAEAAIVGRRAKALCAESRKMKQVHRYNCNLTCLALVEDVEVEATKRRMTLMRQEVRLALLLRSRAVVVVLGAQKSPLFVTADHPLLVIRTSVIAVTKRKCRLRQVPHRRPQTRRRRQ